jgi:ATP-dependent RNA helicase DDX56/DBP9
MVYRNEGDIVNDSIQRNNIIPPRATSSASLPRIIKKKMTIVDGGRSSSSSHHRHPSSGGNVDIIDDANDADMTFHSLCASVGIDPRLRKALSRMGYVRPTLVQSRAIPLAISGGRDLLVRARTGTGKTLAYALPVLHGALIRRGIIAERNGGTTATGGRRRGMDDDECDDDDDDDDDGAARGGGRGCKSAPSGIILVPTRELSDQVRRVLDDLTYYCSDVVGVVSLSSSSIGNGGGPRGGKSGGGTRREMLRQCAMLRDDPDVIVSTPAGLVAHVRMGNLDLSRNVRILVVDEADLILSFGERTVIFCLFVFVFCFFRVPSFGWGSGR